jgi:hypothetical protein
VILVDTKVFVDIWTADPTWGEWSAEALARAAEKGAVGVNPIIYAELCLGLSQDDGTCATHPQGYVYLFAPPQTTVKRLGADPSKGAETAEMVMREHSTIGRDWMERHKIYL